MRCSVSLSLFLTALVRIHITMKFTQLKCAILWILVYSQNCAIITHNFRTFSTSPKNPHTPLSYHPQTLLSPQS